MNKLTNQIVKFILVGGTAFIIDFSIYYLSTEVLSVPYLIAGIISFVVSLIFNYLMSIKWVFRVNHKQTIKEIGLFVMLSVLGLGINQLVLFLAVEIMGLHHIQAKIIATVVVMVFNFITRKLLIEK